MDKGTWEVENDRTCLDNVELLDSPLFDLSRDTLRYGPAATLFAVFQMPVDPLFKTRVAWHRVPLMPLAIDLFHLIFDLEPANHSEICYNCEGEEGHS